MAEFRDNWIIHLYSFHIIMIDIFICLWHRLSTVRTFLLQPLFRLSFLIGMYTAYADAFAAARVYPSYIFIKRQRQIAERAFTERALLMLSK